MEIKTFVITALSTLISFPALAQYKDFDGVPYLEGFQPNQLVFVAYGNIKQSVKVRSTSTCNLLVIKKSQNFSTNGNLTIESPTINFSYSSLGGASNEEDLTINKSICIGEARNPSLKWTQITPGIYGMMGIKDGESRATIYIFGLGKGTYEVKNQIPAQRMIKANACGELKITNNAKWPITSLGSFYYFDQFGNPSDDYSLSTLPQRAPNLCRNGVFYKLYQP